MKRFEIQALANLIIRELAEEGTVVDYDMRRRITAFMLEAFAAQSHHGFAGMNRHARRELLARCGLDLNRAAALCVKPYRSRSVMSPICFNLGPWHIRRITIEDDRAVAGHRQNGLFTGRCLSRMYFKNPRPNAVRT
jgi:hypothetical protein